MSLDISDALRHRAGVCHPAGSGAGSGYFDSPWPAEDGGPARLQSTNGLRLEPGQSLACHSRWTCMSTMTVLGAPGEVFLLTHQALRSNIGLPTTARVERIDPLNLRTLSRSPALAGGPMWPGGVAVHRNGDLYVVYGRHAHRLDRGCALRQSLQLPENLAYNAFVVLDNGLIVTKNLSDRVNARLSVLAPDPLGFACADIHCPEPSIARLGAVGNTVYVVGVRSVLRYHWDDTTCSLRADDGWRFDYATGSGRTWGWDAVLAGRNAWFMDNGDHRYRFRMIGAGVGPAANRLLRVSLTDARDHAALDVSGLPYGSITNPPLVDAARGIVVAYDSANRVMRAWRIGVPGAAPESLWRLAPFGCASHMLLDEASGQLLCNDYRRFGEEVVVLDILSGVELGRVRTVGRMQGVVFPSPGWNADAYWCSMDRLTRVYVQ